MVTGRWGPDCLSVSPKAGCGVGVGFRPKGVGTLQLAWVPWGLSRTLRVLALEPRLPTPWRLHRSC